METLSVRCNHCGAPLQVAGNTRFVTCQFCQSSLEVKRTDSSLFTEEVAQIAENTGKMAESLELIKLQNEIERLDRDWDNEQAKYMLHGTAGYRHKTNPLYGIGVTLFLAGVSLGSTLASGMFFPPGIFRLITIAVGLVAIGSGILVWGKHRKQKVARDIYTMRRAALTRQFETLRQS